VRFHHDIKSNSVRRVKAAIASRRAQTGTSFAFKVSTTKESHMLAPYGIIGLIIFVLDIIAIVSVLGGGGSVEHKLLWTVLILLLPLIGMILYFVLGRSGADA
jgi:hypothetical protein